MKIDCPQCEQAYEFDDQLVPVAGYMAHCSRCAHVFFLARGGIRALEELEETSEMEPSPVEGLDASPEDLDESVEGEDVGSENETREFSGVAVEGADDFDMSGAAFGDPMASEDDKDLDDGLGADDSPTQAADFDEMLALSGTLGEPLTIDSDPYKTRSSVSIGGLIFKGLFALIALAALTAGGLFVGMPDLYNEHLAELTGIRAGTHPRVVALRDEIPPTLKSDTQKDRQKALELLAEGLELEPKDAELLGLGGLVYTLESIRYEIKGQLIRDEGDYASERIRKLSKLSIDERSDGTLDEIKELKQRVFESASQGTILDNQASRNTLLSSRHTGPALEGDPALWTALVARSLEATSNAKSVENADRYLKRIATAFEIQDVKDVGSVNQPWLAIALGYRHIYDPDSLSLSESYFTQAATLEADLVAAQLGLVEVAYRQANWQLAAERL